LVLSLFSFTSEFPYLLDSEFVPTAATREILIVFLPVLLRRKVGFPYRGSKSGPGPAARFRLRYAFTRLNLFCSTALFNQFVQPVFVQPKLRFVQPLCSTEVKEFQSTREWDPDSLVYVLGALLEDARAIR
jgi:hypothetical protein